MRKANFPGMAFSLLFVFGLFNTVAYAQSTDPDNPTVVRQSTVQGKSSSSETVFYYYTFTAGPGVLKVTMDLKSGDFKGSQKLTWELLDANFKELGSQVFYGVNTSERKVNDITLARKQKVILKVKVTEDVQNFKFQFAGAVTFDEDIQDITSDTTETPQQICMPRNGVLILTMGDGKKVKVDLSKVQKIDIQ